MAEQITINPLGDRAVQIGMGSRPSAALHRRIMALCRLLERMLAHDVAEYVPTMTGVAVYYEPEVIGYDALCRKLLAVAGNLNDADAVAGEVVTIPACYGGRHGPDLDDVAKLNDMTVSEVIKLHTGQDYLVYMMGFSPGFPYLTGLPQPIWTPRLATPRTAVPAGSVGIGGEQTGVYPGPTPGGWRIIAHTPLRLWDPAAARPFLLAPGDRVRFSSISAAEHDRIEQAVAEGTYKVQRHLCKDGK